MGALNKAIDYINNNPIALMKYVIIILGYSVSFVNLFDCINGGYPWFDYFMYFGVVFAATTILAVVQSNKYLCFMLALFGVITIFFSDAGQLSGGIVFILFSKRIAGNIMFSALLYIVTAMVFVANCIFGNINPSTTIDILLVYVGIYFMDYLLYNIKRR